MPPLLPSPAEMYGYSGGMPLYVGTWDAVLILYELVETVDLVVKLNNFHELN